MKDNLLVVKFEALKRSPVERVEEVVDFLGISANMEDVVHGVEMARIERAREREQRHFGAPLAKDMSFYRGGQSGQYRDYLVGKRYKKFMRMSYNALKLAGYSE